MPPPPEPPRWGTARWGQFQWTSASSPQPPTPPLPAIHTKRTKPKSMNDPLQNRIIIDAGHGPGEEPPAPPTLPTP